MFCPVCLDSRAEGNRETPFSSVVYCSTCRRWYQYAGTVNHYRGHAEFHVPELAPPVFTDARVIRRFVTAFMLQRGEPFMAIDVLRRTPLGVNLPNRRQLVAIIHILKDRVVEAITQRCREGQFLNLAVDGWSDSRGGRYQGITVRSVSPYRSTETFTALLALKEVVVVHENSIGLRDMVQDVIAKYDIAAKLVNICTDRGSMNIAAFREPIVPGCEWTPCSCHLFNTLLQKFFQAISDHITDIVQLQKALRKRKTTFHAFLRLQGSLYQSLPSFSCVRWYSSSDLFRTMIGVWNHILVFCRQEKVVSRILRTSFIPVLEFFLHISTICKNAQLSLEGDRFGSSARVIPTLLRLIHNMRKAPRDMGEWASQVADAWFNKFRREERPIYLRLLMLTFLSPGINFTVQQQDDLVIPGMTCSQQDFLEMRELLLTYIEKEIANGQPVPDSQAPVAEPDSDDYETPRLQAAERFQTAADEFADYDRNRNLYRTSPWANAPPTLPHLSAVAIRVLSWLMTSSSVERAFSVAGRVTPNGRMSQNETTISAQVMVQVNWNIAEPLLDDVLKMGPREWARHENERLKRKGLLDPHAPVIA
jgi:hypothetical protein